MLTVIAHRGASEYAPENTVAAFDLGLAMGADAIETDIQATADGVLVLLHDSRVDRTTDGQGAIADLAWDSVQNLDAGQKKDPRFAGEKIPTLQAFLDRYAKRCPLYLEIKAPGVESAAFKLVEQHAMLDQVVFTSFHEESVAKVRALASVRVAWTIHAWSAEIAERARSLGAFEVSLPADTISRPLAEEIRVAGFGVRCWRLSDDGLARRAVEAGVDGATVNFPDRLIRIAREYS